MDDKLLDLILKAGADPDYAKDVLKGTHMFLAKTDNQKKLLRDQLINLQMPAPKDKVVSTMCR